MMIAERYNRVLITGGSSYAGTNIAAALLAEGAEVTLLIRPDTEHRLGPLIQRVRWHAVDVWNPASLHGRARGHGSVIHTVGSMVADPAQGFTHHRLNFVSARNAANMCVSDGVPRMILISAVHAPWTSRRYVRARREAEVYLDRVGLRAAIIRAPLTYVRGEPRPFFFRLMTLLGSVPPISWLWLNRIAPMPLDMFARGIARIALDPTRNQRIYYAPDLRKLNKREEVRGRADTLRAFDTPQTDRLDAYSQLEEDSPFGWQPPGDSLR